MRLRTTALAAACSFLLVSAAAAAEGPYKGRLSAKGGTCRGVTYIDLETVMDDAKLDGTMASDGFRSTPKFTGTATPTSFVGNYVFQQIGLRTDIVGTRKDADSFDVVIKFNGGGPSNCEATGSVKKT